jgi:hypothetical protein
VKYWQEWALVIFPILQLKVRKTEKLFPLLWNHHLKYFPGKEKLVLGAE